MAGIAEVAKYNLGAFYWNPLFFRMSYYDHSPSVVRPATPLNDFSEARGPIFLKFYMKNSVNRG